MAFYSTPAQRLAPRKWSLVVSIKYQVYTDLNLLPGFQHIDHHRRQTSVFLSAFAICQT